MILVWRFCGGVCFLVTVALDVIAWHDGVAGLRVMMGSRDGVA